MTTTTPARQAVSIRTAAEMYDVSQDTIRAAIRSGAAYSAPRAPAAVATSTGGQLPPIYIQSPVTGEYLLAQMDSRAMGAIKRTDQQTARTRVGR